MNIPRKGTSSQKICDAIHKSGKAVTIDEGITLHGNMVGTYRSEMTIKYAQMVVSGYLVDVGGSFQLTSSLQKYFDMLSPAYKAASANLVQPRTPPPFTPMPLIKRDARLRADFSPIAISGRLA